MLPRSMQRVLLAGTVLLVSQLVNQLFANHLFANELPDNQPAMASTAIRALLLTSPGVYHNYEYQSQLLAQGIAQHANVHFDISLAQVERWKTSDYSTDYDVWLYNICMANNT